MTKLYYCVVLIDDTSELGRIYCGTRLYRAAEALEPGTCYGTGDTEMEALRTAKADAVRFRMRQESTNVMNDRD